MEDAIVKAAASQIGSLLAEEILTLCAVKDKFVHLHLELDMIHAFLQDVNARSLKDNSEVICTAISHIKDLAHEVQDIVERYLYGVAHKREEGVWNTLRWSCGLLCHLCAIVAQHQVVSDMDQLNEKLSKLSSQLQLYRIEGSGS